MKLIDALSIRSEGNALSLTEWANSFAAGGLGSPFALDPTISTLHKKQEEIERTFEGYVYGAYKANGTVFACMLARLLLFSEARFQFRRRVLGRPGELFGTKALAPLEEPWPGGTTGKLLTRMLQDADLGGNHFSARRPGGRIMRMRPDWVTIVLGSESNPEVGFGDVDAEVLGYIYTPGGPHSGWEPMPLLANEVAHFAPIPDPLAAYRGMSWITPIVREVMGDKAATEHKLKYFEQGAPQPLDAKVLTPEGWTTMGEVQAGSKVIGRDGEARVVTAVYPQGPRDIFRVTFSDGAAVECTEDHLWQVENFRDREVGRSRSLPLSALVDDLAYPSGPLKWSVPYVDPVKFNRAGELPIDPYFFGLLLGDGSFRRGVSLCANHEDADELEEVARKAIPASDGISRRDRGQWSEMRFTGPPGPKSSRLALLVSELGLKDVLGGDKWIPECYMRSSVEDRIALLQGIVDSDGHIDKHQGNATISTASERLADQLVELVGSLGGSASWSRPEKRAIRVWVKRLPDRITPCRLARKAANYKTTNRSKRHRFIQSIERVGHRDAQCIRVDSPDHLYVTDDYVLTHNTPSMVVSFDASIQREDFEAWMKLFDEKYGGTANAYKTMYLGAGSKAEVVGSDLKNIDFRAVQQAGENRIANAAGVPGIIVGLAEGLKAATLANYGEARRHFSDATMRPLWREACGALSQIIEVPTGSELWFDDRDISYLQEDHKDAAEVQQAQAVTMKTLVEAGYTPESAQQAVISNDMSRLEHSGLVSVQLQPPGSGSSAPALPPGE